MFVPVIIKVVFLVLFVALSIIFVINGERRALAYSQGREGPSLVGFFGVLQTAMDGLKIFLKSVGFSKRTFKFAFFFAPVFLIFLGFFLWIFVPISRRSILIDFRYDMVLVYFFLSLDVLIFVLSAWSAFGSKYATLGTIREIAQMCAFELILGFCFIAVILRSGSLNIRGCISAQSAVWNAFIAMPYVYLMYVSMVAEMHRTPFDTTEAEAELTAGYQSEHGGMLFSLFFLAEYNGLLLLSFLFCSFYLGGWFLPSTKSAGLVLPFKACVLCLSVVFLRSSWPRSRLSAMIKSAWSFLLPFSVNGIVWLIWLIFLLVGVIVGDYTLFADFDKVSLLMQARMSLPLHEVWLKKSSGVDVRSYSGRAASLGTTKTGKTFQKTGPFLSMFSENMGYSIEELIKPGLYRYPKNIRALDTFTHFGASYFTKGPLLDALNLSPGLTLNTMNRYLTAPLYELHNMDMTQSKDVHMDWAFNTHRSSPR